MFIVFLVSVLVCEMPSDALLKRIYRPQRLNGVYVHKHSGIGMQSVYDYLTYAYMYDVIQNSPELRKQIEDYALQFWGHRFDFDLFLRKGKPQVFFIVMQNYDMFIPDYAYGIFVKEHERIYIDGRFRYSNDETLFHEFVHFYLYETGAYDHTNESVPAYLTRLYAIASKKFLKKILKNT